VEHEQVTAKEFSLMTNLIGSEPDAIGASSDPADFTLSSTCGVTVYVPRPGFTAVKSYEQDGPNSWRKVSDYNAGYEFAAAEFPLDDIDGLAKLVEALAPENAFLVRGAFSPAARHRIEQQGDAATFNRRMRPKFEGDAPSLIEVSRRWIMVDVDNWCLPPGLNIRDSDDHEKIVDCLIHDLLPACFHEVRAYYQWSNSCGQATSVAKVHLFFWMSKALTSAEVRARFEAHCPQIADLSPFSAVQPHFVANPIFVSGYDLMPRRYGWRDGTEDEVSLPPVPPRPVYVPSPPGSAPAGGSAWLTMGLDQIGDGAGRGGFHSPIRGIIWTYAGHVLRGAITRMDPELIALISRRVLSAPVRDDRSGVEVAGYADHRFLKRKIDEAITKRGLSFTPNTSTHTH
jgi:hypothetical protein